MTPPLPAMSSLSFGTPAGQFFTALPFHSKPRADRGDWDATRKKPSRGMSTPPSDGTVAGDQVDCPAVKRPGISKFKSWSVHYSAYREVGEYRNEHSI